MIKTNSIGKVHSKFLQHKDRTSAIQPRHGWAYGSRGEYVLKKGWLNEGGGINQFEGGKGFPTDEIAGLTDFINEGDASSMSAPVDGYICSGGHAGAAADVVNYTDDELREKKGERNGWPLMQVAPYQEFAINWSYQAPHKTRGYVYWMTKDGWDQNRRISRDQLEPEPFYRDFFQNTPVWNHPLAPKSETVVTLPRKTGRHVMIVIWTIADTGMGFYQTFDLDFQDSHIPSFKAQIEPKSRVVNKGENACFFVSTNTEGPHTYAWNMLPGLIVHDNHLDRDAITYQTDHVPGSTIFNIECFVTNSAHQSSMARAILTVNDHAVPTLEFHIHPETLTTQKGGKASFKAIITQGTGPFHYTWNTTPALPVIGQADQANVEFNLANAQEGSSYQIVCTVMDHSDHSSETRFATIIVEDAGVQSKCTDPAASNYPAWNASTVYSSPNTMVSYNNLVWSNGYYINSEENAPDRHSGWNLVSHAVPNWTPRDYQAGHFVNHKCSQWTNREWVAANVEPGQDPRWIRSGEFSCTPWTIAPNRNYRNS